MAKLAPFEHFGRANILRVAAHAELDPRTVARAVHDNKPPRSAASRAALVRALVALGFADEARRLGWVTS